MGRNQTVQRARDSPVDQQLSTRLFVREDGGGNEKSRKTGQTVF